ncbi:universal stress protein [Diaphorobacter aerolatus]|uniref:Universal stress protein n=1 Tax=Diaphorobacter aerolatus TaxID=1288495 RepID=A0A7H0GLF9_9BURK|nr:universal stress protein [Diaphorobacter aerolatus]QNP49125.1 universal stress protein [Diaphorobacter aerolatus]
MNTPDTVYACIDGLDATASVIDSAAWSARRLHAPITLLHALERPDPLPPVGDYSGLIGVGAQEVLLQRLNELDEERAKIAHQAAHQMIEQALKHIDPESVPALHTYIKDGNLTDVLLEQEPTARLFVLGKGYCATVARKLRLDHRVESVIRSVKQPVLVITAGSFVAPTQFVVAFDGSPTSMRAVQAVARSPLLRGMAASLVMAGEPTTDMLEQLRIAQELLDTSGFKVTTKIVAGVPEEAIPAFLSTRADAFLVLGAYGHSRIRQLIVGSTTTTLLRLSTVPVLVLR